MGFIPRTEAPSTTDKYYISSQYGGYNKCIIIDKSDGSVLPNCVGYAYGRFMEEAGITSCNLSTHNAGLWYGTYDGYPRGQEPKLGAVVCWSGGVNGNGHVAIVESIHEGGEIVTSNSGYYSKKRFFLQTLKPPYNMSGLTFQGFIYNPNIVGGDDMIAIKDGYQEMTYAGQSILLYKQYGNQNIGMVSAGTDGHTVKPIQEIDDSEHIHFCKINASYFQMSNTASDPYGTAYGVVESFNYSQEPRQGKFYVYGVLNDGTVTVVLDNDWWLTKKDVKFAVSPAVIMLFGGKEVEMLSPAIDKSKITTANSQTLLLRREDGFVLVVVKGKLDLYQCKEWALSVGALDMIALDGGGSSQMHWAGGLYSTGRAIPNVITLYKDKVQDSTDTPVEPSEPTDDDDVVIIEPDEPSGGTIDWAQKLSSRKLWVAIAGIVSGILVLAGKEDMASQVGGLILTLGSIIAYIFGEAWTDVTRIKSDDTDR